MSSTITENSIANEEYLQNAQFPPELSFPALSENKKYMAISLDIDAPFPSFRVLGPILHWIQPGLESSSEEIILKSTAPFVADYIGPAPPPGSAPHRYVFLLYEEPIGLNGGRYAPADGAGMSNWYRMRYDLDAWEREIGLGSALGVNYFRSC